MRRPLLANETLLSNSKEMVYRACAPGDYDTQADAPSDAMFRPRTSDNGELSCDRGAHHSAKQAYDYRKDVAQLESKGIWGISVGEVDHAGHNVVDDSKRHKMAGNPCSPAHVFIDMTDYYSLRKRERQAVRQQLLLLARKRGRLYPVPASTTAPKGLF